jgi:hypothetical protein
LKGRRYFHRHLPKIRGNLFKAPSQDHKAAGEIMTQIVFPIQGINQFLLEYSKILPSRLFSQDLPRALATCTCTAGTTSAANSSICRSRSSAGQ